MIALAPAHCTRESWDSESREQRPTPTPGTVYGAWQHVGYRFAVS